MGAASSLSQSVRSRPPSATCCQACLGVLRERASGKQAAPSRQARHAGLNGSHLRFDRTVREIGNIADLLGYVIRLVGTHPHRAGSGTLGTVSLIHVNAAVTVLLLSGPRAFYSAMARPPPGLFLWAAPFVTRRLTTDEICETTLPRPHGGQSSTVSAANLAPSGDRRCSA
jgi:hypothetical protein